MIFDTINVCLVIAKPCRLDIHPVGILGIQERVLSAEKSHAPFTSIGCVVHTMLLSETLLNVLFLRVAANQRRKTVISSRLLCSLSTVGLNKMLFIHRIHKFNK